MQNEELVAEFAKLNPSSTFCTLKEYKSSTGEIADYNIVFHVSYESLLNRSISQLESYIPENEIEAKAKKELIVSYSNSLEKLKTRVQEELEDNYLHFKDVNGNYIKGVKLHKETNTLHCYGLIVNKNVIVKGSFKEVKSSELTLAKNKLSKNLPISKWRQFKITSNQVKSINVQKTNISLG